MESSRRHRPPTQIRDPSWIHPSIHWWPQLYALCFWSGTEGHSRFGATPKFIQPRVRPLSTRAIAHPSRILANVVIIIIDRHQRGTMNSHPIESKEKEELLLSSSSHCIIHLTYYCFFRIEVSYLLAVINISLAYLVYRQQPQQQATFTTPVYDYNLLTEQRERAFAFPPI